MAIDGKIEELLQNVFYDIKAEAVIADLIENGVNIDEVVAISNGIFKRRYARDIASTGEVKLNNGQNLFGIYLNRDSIYNTLPEGLFHERNRRPSGSKEKSSEDSKKIKQEEKAAKNFFLPFENEIIRQRVQLELEERKVLSRFSEKLFDDIYPELWDLHKELDRKYVYRMALMLHFAHKIAGNFKLTAQCLATILDEKVEINVISNSAIKSKDRKLDVTSNKINGLGQNKLGIDFVCGDKFDDYGKTMVFNIGPLENTKISDYLQNCALDKFLDCFYSYFVPMEYDVKANIEVEPLKQQFELSETGGPVLGFESSI